MSWKSCQRSSTFIDRNTPKAKKCSGRWSLYKSKHFLLSNCFTRLSFTKFFSWWPSSSIAMRDLACGELLLRTARSLLFSKRPQCAGRFLHFRWPFKTDRRTTPDWGERESSLDSKFAHACSWRYPSGRYGGRSARSCIQLRTCSIGRFLPGRHRREKNEEERRSTHSFYLKRTAQTENG